MDRGDVESGDGLHEDQRRLQELLCRTLGAASASDGESPLPPGLSSDAARRRARSAAHVENAAADFRELDERLVSSGRAALVHSPRIPNDGGVFAAFLSSADEAEPSCSRAKRETSLATECLDGRERGG